MEKSPIINNPVELKPDFDILEVNEYIKNFVTKLREKLKKLYSYRIDPSTRVEIQTLQGALDFIRIPTKPELNILPMLFIKNWGLEPWNPLFWIWMVSLP